MYCNRITHSNGIDRAFFSSAGNLIDDVNGALLRMQTSCYYFNNSIQQLDEHKSTFISYAI